MEKYRMKREKNLNTEVETFCCTVLCTKNMFKYIFRINRSKSHRLLLQISYVFKQKKNNKQINYRIINDRIITRKHTLF